MRTIKTKIGYKIIDSYKNSNKNILGVILDCNNCDFYNLKENIIYKFDVKSDLESQKNLNKELKSILKYAFQNGIYQLNLVFSSAENMMMNAEKLLDNNNIKYIVFSGCENICENILEDINIFLEKFSLIAAFVQADSDAFKLDKQSYSKIFFHTVKNNADVKNFIPLISMASAVAASDDLTNFRGKKLVGDFSDFHEIIQNSNILDYSFKHVIIDKIKNQDNVNLECIEKSDYIFNFIKKQITKNFKNRVNTSTKLEAIKFQIYMILYNFKEDKLIKDFSVPKVSFADESCVIELDFSVSDYFEEIKINTEIII